MSFSVCRLLAAMLLANLIPAATAFAEEEQPAAVSVQVTGRAAQKQIWAYFANDHAASAWLRSYGVPAASQEFVAIKVKKDEVAPRPPGPRPMPPPPGAFTEAKKEAVRKRVNQDNAAPPAVAPKLPEEICKVDVTRLIPPHIAQLAHEFDVDERKRTSSYGAACYFAGIGPLEGIHFDKGLLEALATHTKEVEKPQSGDIGLLSSREGKPQIPFVVLFPEEGDPWIFVKHELYRVPFQFRRLSQMLRGLASNEIRYYRPRKPSKATVAYREPPRTNSP